MRRVVLVEHRIKVNYKRIQEEAANQNQAFEFLVWLKLGKEHQINKHKVEKMPHINYNRRLLMKVILFKVF